jgi:hypothetical protein
MIEMRVSEENGVNTIGRNREGFPVLLRQPALLEKAAIHEYPESRRFDEITGSGYASRGP